MFDDAMRQPCQVQNDYADQPDLLFMGLIRRVSSWKTDRIVVSAKPLDGHRQ